MEEDYFFSLKYFVEQLKKFGNIFIIFLCKNNIINRKVFDYMIKMILKS